MNVARKGLSVQVNGTYEFARHLLIYKQKEKPLLRGKDNKD